ncbi:hypothetical protein [Priestia megaterium]|uniref:hypothetical protein n=1 Tax=Priestia megaterium TaxID=1404 RepID=UPI001863E611|nr:hypothetical protein [Priestia megaterium]MDH3169337.1 hypothetical protein [Priestia megaterium]
MKVGCNVIFEEKNYTVLWLYNNGTCEIKEQDSLGKVKLVSLSELKVLKKNISFF